LLVVEPASITTLPASALLNPGVTVIVPVFALTPPLVPVLITTEPDDNNDDPVDNLAKPLAPLPEIVDTSTSPLPKRDAVPPNDTSGEFMLKPAEIITEPPAPPLPAVTDTDPPSTPLD